jgi:hypothetical protein
MIFCTALSQGTRVGCITIELKSQSLEYCHPTSPRKKKAKTQPSAGKCMLTVFWDYRGIIHQEYMVKV